MTIADPIIAAVQRCCDAWSRALADKAIAAGNLSDPLDLSWDLRRYAGQAYRNAMPFLSSPVQIDAFIACVAQGMVLNAIGPKDGAKLLYAAQVAIASRRAQQHQQPRTKSEPELEPQLATHPTPTPPQAGSTRPVHPANTADSANPATQPPPTPLPVNQAPTNPNPGPTLTPQAPQAPRSGTPTPTPTPTAEPAPATEKRPPQPANGPTAEQRRAAERLQAWIDKHQRPA